MRILRFAMLAALFMVPVTMAADPLPLCPPTAGCCATLWPYCPAKTLPSQSPLWMAPVRK